MSTKIYAENLGYDTLEQFYEAMRLDCNVQGALMPDAHKGYTLPIGAVIKSKDTVFPSYVGYDIGCGMGAMKFDINVADLDLDAIKAHIVANIPLGADKFKKGQTVIPQGLSKFAAKAFRDVGQYQLGTLGGGNHFIELGSSEDGKLWAVIHSGSRGYGYKIAEHHMREAAIANTDEQRYADEFENNPKNADFKKHNPRGFAKAKDEFVYRRVRARLNTNLEGHYGLDINSVRGKAYLQDMNNALEFALDNRITMLNVIASFLEYPEVLMTINRNHNHAELTPDGHMIHRKGATHADEGMYGVIPGNMKDGSFIVKGKGNPESMNSSSHGAGRVLSRRQAKDTLNLDEFNETMKGVVTNHTDGTLDESPKAYKDIFEVMRLQDDLVEIIEHVRPVLNIKG